MPHVPTILPRAKYSTQVGHIDLVGKSNVSGILIEDVAVAQPVELEGEVERATDGRATKHGLKDISLRKRSSLNKFLSDPSPIIGNACQ